MAMAIAIRSALFGIAMAFFCSSAKPQAIAAPDVYLVTIDTLRADHVHCYGYQPIQTPALDALARDGVRFTQAFTPSPITNTSHASILTGLLPSVHGVTGFAMPLADTWPTWAQLLKGHGYQTAAFIGAVILDSHSLAPGFDRGFDYYDNFPVKPPAGSHWGTLERRGGDVVHRAEAWMDAHPRGPRFVWVHLYDPHDPYDPPPPYSRIYKDRLYDGEIAYADAALGDLAGYLKRHNRYRNAVIIVVGDHGEGLGEHGEQTHGIFLYNATTHVPLIVKLPNGATAEVEAPVQTTDILPAVLDLLGIPRPAILHGPSLTPYLAGTVMPGRPIFGETDYPLRFGWSPLRAVSIGDFKLIEAPRAELYDTASDPHEISNLYEPWNDHVKALRTVMAASALKPPSSHGGGALSSNTLSELRALGYFGRNDEGSSSDVPDLSALPDPKDKIEEQNLLHAAMILLEQHRLTETEPLCEKLLLLNPNSTIALQTLGQLAMQRGQYQRAADYLERAQKASPDAGEVEPRLLLAQAYLKLKQPAAAEDQLEAARILSPQNLEVTLQLAEVYLAEAQYNDAIDLLLQPSKAPGAQPQLSRLLARAYQGLAGSRR
jgi:arylsulfatase A-like enzyme